MNDSRGFLNLGKYLIDSNVVNWRHEKVFSLSQELSRNQENKLKVSQVCFEWVRDKITHSGDVQSKVITCSASEVLKEKTGYCFAKANLLVALLRGNSIPAGFSYQRLNIEGTHLFSLHGLVSLYLDDFGWYRVDSRGNKEGLSAEFDPPKEKLAWSAKEEGEMNFSPIYSSPLPVVIEALRMGQASKQGHLSFPDLSDLPVKQDKK